jgi:hypothetical protein
VHPEDFAEGDAVTRQDLLSGGSILRILSCAALLVLRTFQTAERVMFSDDKYLGG